MVTDDELAAVISAATDAFFAEVDAEDTDTDDLAWSIVHAIRTAEKKPRFAGCDECGTPELCAAAIRCTGRHPLYSTEPPAVLREIAPGVHYVSKDGDR